MKITRSIIAVLLAATAGVAFAITPPGPAGDEGVRPPLMMHLAMGPDPGGHSGATVTPETTKTDSPAVDAARQSASGSKTETNKPPLSPAPDSNKK